MSANAHPGTAKKRVVNRLQEALRKEAQRLYAVMTARWHIAMHTVRYVSVERITVVSKAVSILHNMVTVVHRGSVLSRRRARAQEEGL